MHVPRLAALARIDAMLVRAHEFLLIHAAVNLAISSLEPAQAVRRAVIEAVFHLCIGQFARSDKLVHHFCFGG